MHNISPQGTYGLLELIVDTRVALNIEVHSLCIGHHMVVETRLGGHYGDFGLWSEQDSMRNITIALNYLYVSELPEINVGILRIIEGLFWR